MIFSRTRPDSYDNMNMIIKIIKILFCLSLIILISCGNPTEFESPRVERLPAIEINRNSNSSLVCFGTSLTYGYIAPSQPIWTFTYPQPVLDKPVLVPLDKSDGYPGYLGKRLKIAVYNKGFIGARIDYALSVVADSVLSLKPALVLLEFPANDFLQNRSVEETEPKLRSLIMILLEAGSSVVLISFVDQYALNHPPQDHPLVNQIELAKSYFNMLAGLAAEFNILFVKDCFTGIFGDEEYMSDSIHPNEAGYRKMADNILTALDNTFKFNHMYH